jgi:hypothetical protein
MPLFILLLALSSPSAHAKVFSQGIYGDDHRREPYELEDERMISLMGSSVALIDDEHIARDGKVYRLTAQTYGKEYGIRLMRT